MIHRFYLCTAVDELDAAFETDIFHVVCGLRGESRFRR